ncbi:MAG TPA: S-layer homology domain-containing protein [Negativicutes bacterium]|jgi:hypothetical protein
MKKSIILTLALVLLVSISGTTFAANISDVPAKHWAYDAVSQLSKAGLIEGFGDGTFRGDKPLTRYEFAVVTARALEKYSKADAQQKALLDKLATEFVTELNTIGVRLTKLEKNQPNLKFTGSSEIRYTAQDNNGTVASAAGGAYRLRLDGLATVDENTALGIRVASGTTKAGTQFKYSSATFTGFGSNVYGDDNKNTYVLDRYFLTRNIGAVKTTLGAQELKLGTTSFIVDSGAYSFDGVKFAGKTGVVNLVANWGRQQKNSAVAASYKIGANGAIVATPAIAATTLDVASLEAATSYGKLQYGVGYATLKDSGDATTTLAKYLYGNATYTFDTKFSVGGEYVQNRQSDTDKNAWVAIATIGDQAIVKKGQNNLVIKYYSVGKNSISRLTTYNLQNKAAAATTEAFSDVQNQKGLNIAYNYGFSKNLYAYAAYQKLTDKEITTANTDQGYQFYRVAVVAKF